MDIQKTYQYHIYKNGTFLGLLPNVTSDFGYSQDMNTSFVPLTVECSISADVADQELEPLLDEDGEILLDENNEIAYPERPLDVVGSSNPLALLQENNDLKVYEISSYYPDGVLVFSGYIESWDADLGTADDKISITAVSDGIDLSDYLVVSDPYVLDQTQTSEDAAVYSGADGDDIMGQTFRVGAGVTNVAAIEVALENDNVEDQVVTVSLINGLPPSGQGTPVASATRVISSSEPAQTYLFAFPQPYEVSPNQDMFFRITVAPEEGTGIQRAIIVYYESSAAAYANGEAYIAFFGQSFRTMASIGLPSDLYFNTYSSLGETVAPFTSQDVSTMLETSLDTYGDVGGSVTYTPSSIDTTGVVTDYTFNTASMLEAVQKFKDLAPSDFYWYVDPATSILYFKQTATTATHTFIKGKHLESIHIAGTVEPVRNVVYFSGGDTGGGENLYILDINQDSLDTQGRRRMERLSDNRVTIPATAELITGNYLEEHSGIVYSSPVTINAKEYDITTINVGDTAAIAGFGNFIDYLILQIARVTRRPDSIDIVLGVVLDRQGDKVTQALRDLDKLQTLDNPTAPS